MQTDPTPPSNRPLPCETHVFFLGRGVALGAGVVALAGLVLRVIQVLCFRHRGCRLEHVPSGRSCGLPRGKKPLPPAPPPIEPLPIGFVCPSASGPCWGLRLARGPKVHRPSVAHLPICRWASRARTRRAPSSFVPLRGTHDREAYAYPLKDLRLIEGLHAPSMKGLRPYHPFGGPADGSRSREPGSLLLAVKAAGAARQVADVVRASLVGGFATGAHARPWSQQQGLRPRPQSSGRTAIGAHGKKRHGTGGSSPASRSPGDDPRRNTKEPAMK